MEYQASDDRLSSLPLTIIHDILGRVPVITAIRTCMLSRQWRYTWTTLPHLCFEPNDRPKSLDLSDEEDEWRVDEFKGSLIDFINNVLLHHKGPIHRFEMCSPLENSDSEHVQEWVHHLSSNGIKELIVRNYFWNRVPLKSSIYSCGSLTKYLILQNFTLDPPPSTFKGFLLLKQLSLIPAEISPDGLETLVDNCPLLEILEYMSSDSKIRIRSPNLKVIYITGNYTELCLYAPLLQEMDVKIHKFRRKIQSLVCNYTNFFGGFTNLVQLTGRGFFTRYLSVGIESCVPTLSFHHLETIKLYLSFGDSKEVSVLARLIIDAPNLHKLEINMLRHKDGTPDVSFWDYFGLAPNGFTLEKLTYVSLLFVCGDPTGMQLVKFLLETSPLLETMELKLADATGSDEVSTQVLGFPRASPNARILVLTRY